MYKYICARFDPCKTESKRDKVTWISSYSRIDVVEDLPVSSRITHRIANHRNELINIIINPTYGFFYVYVPITNPFKYKDSDAILSYIWDSICTEVNEVKGAKITTLYKLDRDSGKYAILNCFGMNEEEYYERFIK